MNDLTKEKTMTTKELAEVLCVNKDTINATIERLELDGVLRRVDVKKNNYGGYLLNEKQATLIKLKLRERNNLKDNSVVNQITNDLEFLR